MPAPRGRRRAVVVQHADDFGTPRDITLEELAVELFFPADEATERVLRDPGSGQDAPGQGVAPVP
ncbi:MAG TPA: hypothetical protein VMU14_04025 [Acidimicrobiales bacterium]|nr:hypothetical protein [Acidimicrobiales bacterium]